LDSLLYNPPMSEVFPANLGKEISSGLSFEGLRPRVILSTELGFSLPIAIFEINPLLRIDNDQYQNPEWLGSSRQGIPFATVVLASVIGVTTNNITDPHDHIFRVSLQYYSDELRQQSKSATLVFKESPVYKSLTVASRGVQTYYPGVLTSLTYYKVTSSSK
jgi:hypothetical protein